MLMFLILGLCMGFQSVAHGADPVGVDQGSGFCPLHHLTYSGQSCPKCSASRAATGGSSGGASSVAGVAAGPSLQNQVLLGAATQLGTALGQMLAGDPQETARLQAAAAARSLELQRQAEIDAAAAEQKRRETYSRLRASLKLQNFDGDDGSLQLKGVGAGTTAGSGDGPQLMFGGPGGGDHAELKLKDEDLKPHDQAFGHVDAPGVASPVPNGDPMVVDLRDYQRAAYVATLPDASDDAIVSSALGDTSVIAMPPADAQHTLSGDGLRRFQEASTTYRRSHDDGALQIGALARAQARREIAGRELDERKQVLVRELEQQTDPASRERTQKLMAQVFAVAKAEHEAWLSSKAEADRVRSQEDFDRAMLVRTVKLAASPHSPAYLDAARAEFIAMAPSKAERSMRAICAVDIDRIDDEKFQVANVDCVIAADHPRMADMRRMLDRLIAVSYFPDEPIRLVIVGPYTVAGANDPRRPEPPCSVGRTIYLSAGDLAAKPSDDQMLFILGHELAHLQRSDSLRYQATVDAVDLQFDQVDRLNGRTATNPTPAQAKDTEAAKDLALIGFARTQETEADRAGAAFMLAAGGKPAGITEAFRWISSVVGPEAGNEATQDHPKTRRRYDTMRRTYGDELPYVDFP